MKVLCLSGERRVAYLIKHVLQFEGYGVTLGRSVAEAFANALQEFGVARLIGTALDVLGLELG